MLGTVFFWADDGQHGQELWKTDGSAAGTSLVADLSPGAASTRPRYPGVALGARLVFGAALAGCGEEPCITDGTEAGTRILRDIVPGTASSFPGQFVAAAGRVFFPAGSGLWVTDGSPEGTIQLGEARPTSSLVPFRGGVAYAAYEAVHGFELWHSDGTVAGTRLLVDIVPGPASSEPQNLAVDGDRLFFAASRPDTGRELFVSDGTDTGTTVVIDRTPGAGSSTITEVRAGAGRVFWIGTDSYGGRVLFASDGTPASVRGMSGVYRPAELTLVGPTCYFAASSIDNTYNPYLDDRELYVCDGTSARRVRDIYVGGTSGSGPRNLFAVGTEVYFTAVDPEHGGELWRTDGTEEGTRLVADLAPGPRSSSPGQFVRSLGSIYFAATDLLKGAELFVLDLPGGFAVPVGEACGPGQAMLAAELSTSERITFRGTGPADGIGFLLLGPRAQPPAMLPCGCLLLAGDHPIVRPVRPAPGFEVEFLIPGRKEFQGQIFAAQVVFGGPVDPRISQTSNTVYISLE